MIGSIHTNMIGGTLTEKDFDKMLQLAMRMKPVKIPQKIIVWASKKAIRKIKAAFKEKTGDDKVLSFGISVFFHERPYAKKIRIIKFPEMNL